MIFKKFKRYWKSKLIFCIKYIILFAILSVLFIKSFNLMIIRFNITQSSEKLNYSQSNKCTIEQSQKHGDLFVSSKSDWSGCYTDSYLMAFDNYSTSIYTLIDVGLNKAYAVATWLAFFLPQLGIDQANLGQYLASSGKVTYTCGSCNDCQDKSLKRTNIKQKVTLHIHAFEPQPGTVDVLKGIQTWMNVSGKSESTFDIYGMAVSDYVGQVPFKKCNPGNEVCSLDVSKVSIDAQVQVDVITLDRFADKHNLSTIDILKIDTEGYEPLVFQGTKHLLQQHRIRLFIFEYLKTGVWMNTSLPIEISNLADLGYICYMIGKTGVLLVTNCWNNKLDIPHSNLLCVSSRDKRLVNNINQMRSTGSIPAE